MTDKNPWYSLEDTDEESQHDLENPPHQDVSLESETIGIEVTHSHEFYGGNTHPEIDSGGEFMLIYYKYTRILSIRISPALIYITIIIVYLYNIILEIEVFERYFG